MVDVLSCVFIRPLAIGRFSRPALALGDELHLIASYEKFKTHLLRYTLKVISGARHKITEDANFRYSCDK